MADLQIRASIDDQMTTQLTKMKAQIEGFSSSVRSAGAGGGGLDGLANAANKASKEFGVLDTAAGKFIGRVAYFTAIGYTIHAVSDAVQGLAASMASYNAKMEQTQQSYQTFLGSVESANEFISDMKDFSARTPFEFEDVDSAAKKLMAFGWAAKDVIPDLTAVGNAASALGLEKDGIDRIVLALGLTLVLFGLV